MFSEDRRFFAPSGTITPGGPTTWNILDWDQRRIIAVTMEDEQDNEEIAVQHLRQHIDDLPSQVCAVAISKDGNMTTTSTDPGDDETTWEYYPPLEKLCTSNGMRTILRSDLTEMERLGPNVDLVAYTRRDSVDRRVVVFKYYFLHSFMHKIWYELHLWLNLPPHPNIVPFDRVVRDEVYKRVVGFTTKYIPGGTIWDNVQRTFRLDWLRQLMAVIDDLNLKYGVAHQDVAPRNLLVDTDTDSLMLFDFSHSGSIGGTGYMEHQDDVSSVILSLYEIVTRDLSLRETADAQANSATVCALSDWVQHPDVTLDCPISEFRSTLDAWVTKRREGVRVSHYDQASEPIRWPAPLEPQDIEVMVTEGNVLKLKGFGGLRRDERLRGRKTIDWERLAWNAIEDRECVLANGVLVSKLLD